MIGGAIAPPPIIPPPRRHLRHRGPRRLDGPIHIAVMIIFFVVFIGTSITMLVVFVKHFNNDEFNSYQPKTVRFILIIKHKRNWLTCLL